MTTMTDKSLFTSCYPNISNVVNTMDPRWRYTASCSPLLGLSAAELFYFVNIDLGRSNIVSG